MAHYDLIKDKTSLAEVKKILQANDVRGEAAETLINEWKAAKEEAEEAALRTKVVAAAPTVKETPKAVESPKVEEAPAEEPEEEEEVAEEEPVKEKTFWNPAGNNK